MIEYSYWKMWGREEIWKQSNYQIKRQNGFSILCAEFIAALAAILQQADCHIIWKLPSLPGLPETGLTWKPGSFYWMISGRGNRGDQIPGG